jgi:hypothetical protein
MRKVTPRYEQIPVALVKKMIEKKARKKKDNGNGASLLKTPTRVTLVEARPLTVRRHAGTD